MIGTNRISRPRESQRKANSGANPTTEHVQVCRSLHRHPWLSTHGRDLRGLLQNRVVFKESGDGRRPICFSCGSILPVHLYGAMWRVARGRATGYGRTGRVIPDAGHCERGPWTTREGAKVEDTPEATRAASARKRNRQPWPY